jgi:hypothetical protein
MNPNNASLLCLTAAAGTELAEASFGSAQRRRLFTCIACETLTAVYIPKDFLLHAALLGQACAHCPRFVTAATRRCPGSVSVPMRRATLSRPLPVAALVSHYLTNKLIGHGPLQDRQAGYPVPALWAPGHATRRLHRALAALSLKNLAVRCYSRVKDTLPMHYSPVRH